MKIFIVGNKGNMGRRYAAILRYLGHETDGIDQGVKLEDAWGRAHSSDAIIIASPTALHVEHIVFYATHMPKKPVLCEKPWALDKYDVDALIDWLQGDNCNVSMVNQYKYFTSPGEGLSYYDYWNSGPHGLGWDCINILGLAKKEVILKDYSPIWKCQINGREWTVGEMDYAYIRMIEAWLKKPEPDYKYILRAHRRAHDFSINSSTGEEH